MATLIIEDWDKLPYYERDIILGAINQVKVEYDLEVD